MKNPLITEVQQNDKGISPYTETICNRLIAENGGLSMGDLNQVLSLVRIKFPEATDQVVSQIVKFKITD